MRAKAKIQQLTATAATVNFPRHDPALARFKEAFCAVLAENFRIDTRDVNYDEYGGVFYWCDERYNMVAKINGAAVLIKRNFEVDPNKPLAEEIARVAAEYETYRKDRNAIAKAIVALGGEV